VKLTVTQLVRNSPSFTEPQVSLPCSFGVIFRHKLFFYGEELLAPRPTPKVTGRLLIGITVSVT